VQNATPGSRIKSICSSASTLAQGRVPAAREYPLAGSQFMLQIINRLQLKLPGAAVHLGQQNLLAVQQSLLHPCHRRKLSAKLI